MIMANGMAKRRPRNKHTAMAPDANGIPKEMDGAEMESGDNWFNDPERDAENFAIKMKVMKTHVINNMFLFSYAECGCLGSAYSVYVVNIKHRMIIAAPMLLARSCSFLVWLCSIFNFRS